MRSRRRRTPTRYESANNLCTAAAPLATPCRSAGTAGAPASRTRVFRTPKPAASPAADVPRLRLKWAYGLPREQQPRGQPAVIGGRLVRRLASRRRLCARREDRLHDLAVLPARRLAQRDSRSARTASRTAATATPSTSSTPKVTRTRSMPIRGEQIWMTRVEDHPMVRGTGAVTLLRRHGVRADDGHQRSDGRRESRLRVLHVPRQHDRARRRDGRGALEDATRFPSRSRAARAAPASRSAGPAGVGIWNAPTVDARRGLIYSGTGPAYAGDDPPTTDAVIAFNMKSGEIVWTNQFTKDTWLMGCDGKRREQRELPEGERPGSRLLGLADPHAEFRGPRRDRDPAEVRHGLRARSRRTRQDAVELSRGARQPRRRRLGQRGGRRPHVRRRRRLPQRGDRRHPRHRHRYRRARLVHAAAAAALRAGGRRVQRDASRGRHGHSRRRVLGLRRRRACAPTTRATARVVWTFDANREFETVNGVPARGASFDGSGPVVAGGMLYVLSGDAGFVGRPGNVLLAFAAE